MNVIPYNEGGLDDDLRLCRRKDDENITSSTVLTTVSQSFT